MPTSLLVRYFQVQGAFGDLDFAAVAETQWHLAHEAGPNAAIAFTEKPAAMANHFGRVMVTYLDHNPFWRGAKHFYQVDTL